MSVPADGVQPSDAGVEAIVAMSLLRPGPDTAAARLFKELSEAGAPTIGDLARRLETPPGARASKVQRAVMEAPRALADASRLGLAILPFQASGYPERLRQLPDPPIVLWIRGCAEALDSPAVAIVGSRTATPTGISVATRLGRELSDAGLVVVSGLARGVDAAAHRGALDGSGRTVAVLGSGADVIAFASPAGGRGKGESAGSAGSRKEGAATKSSAPAGDETSPAAGASTGASGQDPSGDETAGGHAKEHGEGGRNRNGADSSGHPPDDQDEPPPSGGGKGGRTRLTRVK